MTQPILKGLIPNYLDWKKKTEKLKTPISNNMESIGSSVVRAPNLLMAWSNV
jgi:hypothetical protein